MGNASFFLCGKRPSLSKLIPGAPKRIHERRPPQGGFVGIHHDQDSARLRNAMSFLQRLEKGVLVVSPRLLVPSLTIGGGDTLLLLWRQLASKMLGIQKP